jgi:hypothetical protein
MTVRAFPVSSTAQQQGDALPARLTPQPFPEDAHAVIYRPARSAMTSGKARTRAWKLRFERRRPPFIEPLMGWTGGNDPLTQVELSFPSAESAIAYARRLGLHYTVAGMPQRTSDIRLVASTGAAERAAATARRQRLEWVERTLGPDLIRQGSGPGADPAARYADPQDVLRDPSLDQARKRDLLHRWAIDAYLLDLASNGAAGAEASRLQDVIDALIDLDGPLHADLRNRDRDGNPAAQGRPQA